MDTETKEVKFEVPEGYEEVEYDFDRGRYECPKCGENDVAKHSGKPIARCHSCGTNFNYREKTQPFLREA
jgi:ribosomal protein L37AE/L43A